MTFFDLDPLSQRRIRAGEPAELKRFFEKLCDVHRISYEYTAYDRPRVSATAARRVPPPIDLAHFSVCLHEPSHVLIGPCPNTGAHQDHNIGTSLACLLCETRAWDRARQMVPFIDRAMFNQMRRGLGSYRSSVAAPAQHNERPTGLWGPFGSPSINIQYSNGNHESIDNMPSPATCNALRPSARKRSQGRNS